jgi:hypothetical protein
MQTEERRQVVKLLTAEDVAKELGHLSPATVRRLAKQGAVPYVKGARGKVLFTRDQVQGLLDYLTQPTRTPEKPAPSPMGVDSLTSPRSQARAGIR